LDAASFRDAAVRFQSLFSGFCLDAAARRDYSSAIATKPVPRHNAVRATVAVAMPSRLVSGERGATCHEESAVTLASSIYGFTVGKRR